MHSVHTQASLGPLPVYPAREARRVETRGPALERGVGYLLVVGYLLLAVAGPFWSLLPRIFWTVLLPLLPIGIVLMGFSRWRRICPLAAIGELGRRLNPGNRRKAPTWLQRSFFVVSFAILLGMLVLRLVVTNGDSRWLAALMAILALAAIVTNTRYTGKTWCNYLCPVGLVERIYTEPGSLVRQRSNSMCASCTACKRFCPDIDQENGYWRELMDRGRQIASYAFPGLVLAFYLYFWLRAGEWEAYFDGRWTRLPVSQELLAGSGLFFAESVPAFVAATATLLLLSLASYGLFFVVERGLRRRIHDPERRRHVVLTLASFTAFCTFYLFAGAPTLGTMPGGRATLGLTALAVATLVMAQRWRHSRQKWARTRAWASTRRSTVVRGRSRASRLTGSAPNPVLEMPSSASAATAPGSRAA
jgi:hypothetical protein